MDTIGTINTRNDFKLLDCTLRDGGYINNWKWGYQDARDIISNLVNANVDIVEVGFLRNVDGYHPDITVCNCIEELNQLLPYNTKNTIFSAMAMQSNYDIGKLIPYSGTGIEMIRITAHDYDIADGMDFAKEVKSKGYKLSINPINIMGYSDERILWILDQVNKIQPYQFSIVDTFGSMKRRDLDRIVSLADNNLERTIRVGLHLHENMSLSCSLAQNFIDKHLNRPISVDASLMGMGRIPGNLPIELIADYLNDYTDKSYDIDYLMDAIQDYIAPIKKNVTWGYTPAYFLSARFNLHRNYAEYYVKQGDLTTRDINHILSRFDRGKATAYDESYAEKIYNEYKNNHIDDSADRSRLKADIENQTILVLAPGATLSSYSDKIRSFIISDTPRIISVNFIPPSIKVDYGFFGNAKRLEHIEKGTHKLIFTSNITGKFPDYVIDHNSVSGAFEQGGNSLIMLLKLLRDLGAEKIVLAGADGFSEDCDNYYCSNIKGQKKLGTQYNLAVSSAIKSLGINIEFLTPSNYSIAH